MFTKIRNRLTLRYTLVMMCLMLTFILASASGLLWILYQEEQQDLRSLIQEEVEEQIGIYEEQRGFFQIPDSEANKDGSKIFYYVFDADGKLETAKKPAPAIQNNLLNIIQNWEAEDGEVTLEKFTLPYGSDAVVIMSSKQMYLGDKLLGTVFMGEDISSYFSMLKTLFAMMLVLALIFLVFAALAGHFLARKAMEPINLAFTRQREFVADASHELRTPLSVLKLSVEAVQNDNEQKLSPFSLQVLEDMNIEVTRMTQLVSDLLKLARADAGVINIIKEKFDLVIVAETLIRSVKPLATAKNITLSLTGASELNVMADKERINQLLVILIDNAIKYTPSEGQITINLTRQGGSKPTAVIKLKDTGDGISKEEQKLIFERFYRSDKARTCGGTGLGLSIAKWIVDVHNGKVEVESEPGKGSTFTITLPI